MATVRFFAAAREAAGVTECRITAATVAELRAALVEQFGARMGQVLDISSVVSDGRRVTGDDTLDSDSRVDVLPPFAGG